MSSHTQRNGTTGKRHGSHASTRDPHTARPGSRRDSGRGNRFEPRQILIVGTLMAVAFFSAYSFARSGNVSASATPAASQTAVTPISAADAAARAGAGAVKIENGVQKVSVQVGFKYTPDVVRLKAGVPAEITFGEGQGCTAIVQSQALGFREDLTSGPKTVKLDGLQPGTYMFACGMNMVRGQIVVS